MTVPQWFLPGALFLAAWLAAGPAASDAGEPTDPMLLQQQAVGRIDAFVDHFRHTGDFQSRRGELEQAIAELTRSNAALARQGDSLALALGLTKQGSALRMLGRFPEAIITYQQAAEVADRSGETAAQADALAWKSMALDSQNDLGPALADATRAVALAENARDPDVLARALDVLAIAQIRQRDFNGAADTLNREIEVAKDASDPMTAYFAYFNRSDLFLKMAAQCDIKPLFDACLNAMDLADADLRRAREIAHRLGYGGLEARTRAIAGNLSARRALIEGQRNALHTTGQLDALFHPKQASDILVSEGFVTPNEDWPLLLPLLEASDREEQKAGAFAGTSKARSLYVQGQMRMMQGRIDEALGLFQRAVDALERDRRSLRDERARGAFMEDRVEVYYATVLALLQQGRQADAFTMFERARSRALADLLASRRLTVGGSAEQALYAQAGALRARIADAQGRLFDPLPGDRSDPRALTQQIDADQAAYQSVLSRLAREAPRLYALVESQPVSLAALQESMRAEGYEVLQYMVTESGVILWHITKSEVFVRHVFIPRSVLMTKLAALREGLETANTPFDAATARELFLYLIAPVLPRLQGERLVIIPHEDLDSIPFQVLVDPSDGRYLVERLQISYAPSATVLLGLHPAAALRGARVLAAADPSLEGAVGEVETIGRLFAGASQGPAAGGRPGAKVLIALPHEAELTGLVAGRDLVHLAVHGAFDAGEPMLSYLALAPGDDDDGHLTAAEMFGLPLDNSRLVTLSACETGRAAGSRSNESLGMSRALLYAGANALLLSQWQVGSAATAQWMRAFYAAALEQPLPAAAQTAALEVKNRPGLEAPFYWAAFTLLGR